MWIIIGDPDEIVSRCRIFLGICHPANRAARRRASARSNRRRNHDRQRRKSRDLVSPGVYYKVVHGMGLKIVPTSQLDWPRRTRKRPKNTRRRSSCRATIDRCSAMSRVCRFHSSTRTIRISQPRLNGISPFIPRSPTTTTCGTTNAISKTRRQMRRPIRMPTLRSATTPATA